MLNSLEQILADIYTLDPSLKESDADVRLLVTALLEAKPQIAPSESFVRELRVKLQTVPVTIAAPKPILSPWVMYLTPVGLMAVLVLVLVPDYLSAPTLEYDSTPTSLEGGVFMESMDTYDAKRSGGSEESDVSIMQMNTMMMAPEDSISISTQPPGNIAFVDYVSLTSPGFIVIKSSLNGEPGEVLGVSIYLKEGMTEQIQIVLQKPMGIDQTFFAMVYQDDGDARFDLGNDTLLFDASGTMPLQQMFSTLPLVTN